MNEDHIWNGFDDVPPNEHGGNTYYMKGGNVMKLKEFIQNEEGMGTVEMILIIVVLIGLVIIFKDKITALVNKLFDTINTRAGSI